MKYFEYETEQKKNIDINHLENIFSNEIYYQSMKNLSLLEKSILYFSIIKSYKLEDICKKLKLSKKDVIRIKENSIKHFISNVQKLKNSTFKGGANNE